MPRVVSQQMLAAAMAQQTDEVLVVLLKLDQDSWSVPVYVCNNSENVTSSGQVYLSFPFDISLPDQKEGKEPSSSVSISLIDQQLIVLLRSIQEPPTVTLSVVLASTPNVIEYGPIDLIATDVRITKDTATMSLRFDPFGAEPFPWLRFTPEYFPGMFK